MASNSIQGPAFWKVRLCSGNNHNPHAPLLSKAKLAFFSPNPLISRGQCGAGLPLAPWALLFCWWSPEMETHSNGFLLRGEAGVGRKMPSGRRPQQFPRSQLGRSIPRPKSTLGSKHHSGAAFWKVQTPRGTNHSPNAPLLNKATLAFFSPSRLVSRGQ